ncbi:MAG: hypothetical protein PVF73_09330, partial [Bacteroidales bacterium]
MRTLILLVLLGIAGNVSFSQTGGKITEKRNVYNEKGDYYFERKEFKKAIVFYNMAYRKDEDDYFSVLKKAEAYTKLNWYPQAEECYRIVFGANREVDNVYRLKYALLLLDNNNPGEFKKWLEKYNEIIEEEIEGENYLISSEQRVKLYKDSTIVLVSDEQKADTFTFKVKYEGYRFRRRSASGEDELNLILSNGEEYMVTPSAGNDFEFSFLPAENYKIVIREENLMAEDILRDKTLTPEQRKKEFLNPPPVQMAELKLHPGMKYRFTAGKNSISPQYMSTLKEKAGTYLSPDQSAIDLSVLAKELQLSEGSVYTVRFVKDEDQGSAYKGKEITTLFLNDRSVSIFAQSFFVLLPQQSEINFNVQTDIDALEQNFSSKRYAVLVDEGPIFREEMKDKQKWLLSLSVNTESIEEVIHDNRLSAKEISIIPGMEYILTLSKPDPDTGEDIEIIVPLTRGVKYNLTSSKPSNAEYREALAELFLGREDLELANEEVIDISVLSKELEVKPGEDLTFHLLPVKQFGKKQSLPAERPSSLALDEKVFEITRDEKYTINVPFNPDRKVNLQTDLNYVQEHFEPENYTMRLDTVSFTSEITVDTTGYGAMKDSGWLVSMSINTESAEEVEMQNQYIAREVSIIPGKEYILTVSKIDGNTGEEEEIIVPLTRHVKYDFTSHPGSEKEYRESLDKFLTEREDVEVMDGEVIDIRLISKELKIKEGDDVSFSLLPVKRLPGIPAPEGETRSSLYLDHK